MKSFEPVFNKLSELFIEDLPEYIRKINEKYNDGIILKPFENKDLITTCNKLPCFKLSTEKAEYTEKDRIIETTIFVICITVIMPPNGENSIVYFWRYIDAISTMLNETTDIEEWLTIDVNEILKNNIYIKITL